MKNIGVYIIGIIFIIAVIFSVLFSQETNQVCFENHCFEVELAITEEEQTRGLAEMESLEKNKGMLFIFEEEGIYGFWMKDMKFNLDILWIDSNGYVVDIGEDLPACNGPICLPYTPEKETKYVLEINANRTKESGIKLGSRLDLHLITS